jgi:RHS repeat-associated protein
MFTGRRLDAETNLYYYRARFYDSTQGRFLQRDLIGYVKGGPMVRSPSQTIPGPFSPSRQLLDTETGLMYSMMRYYRTELIRLVSQHAMEYSEGMNLYEYVGSQPTRNIDPLGLAVIREAITRERTCSFIKPCCMITAQAVLVQAAQKYCQVFKESEKKKGGCQMCPGGDTVRDKSSPCENNEECPANGTAYTGKASCPIGGGTCEIKGKYSGICSNTGHLYTKV